MNDTNLPPWTGNDPARVAQRGGNPSITTSRPQTDGNASQSQCPAEQRSSPPYRTVSSPYPPPSPIQQSTATTISSGEASKLANCTDGAFRFLKGNNGDKSPSSSQVQQHVSTSFTTARWYREPTPEERLRLGLSRHATQADVETARRAHEDATQQADRYGSAPRASRSPEGFDRSSFVGDRQAGSGSISIGSSGRFTPPNDEDRDIIFSTDCMEEGEKRDEKGIINNVRGENWFDVAERYDMESPPIALMAHNVTGIAVFPANRISHFWALRKTITKTPHRRDKPLIAKG
jgi:hypothetical protein